MNDIKDKIGNLEKQINGKIRQCSNWVLLVMKKKSIIPPYYYIFNIFFRGDIYIYIYVQLLPSRIRRRNSYLKRIYYKKPYLGSCSTNIINVSYSNFYSFISSLHIYICQQKKKLHSSYSITMMK